MKKFCVIGKNIKHSKSPQIHQAGFSEFEIEAEFSIKNFEKEKELKDFLIKDFRENFSGAAVTIPYKETVFSFCDEVSESAQKIGAINTLSNEKGKIIGNNTDGIGFYKAISTEVLPDNKNVLILGAGGVTRSIILACKTANCQITIWNRTTAKAEILADEFLVNFAENLDDLNFSNFEIIINTTSVGQNEWKSILPPNFWSNSHTAFDVVYTPLETKFLNDAEKAGAKTITGDKMLIYQAMEQFYLWHKLKPEPEIFEKAFFY